MFKKIVHFCIIAMIAGIAFSLHLEYNNINISRLFDSAIAIAFAYLFLNIFLDEIVGKKIKNSKTRYSFRKIIHLLFICATFFVLLHVWVVNPKALLVAYGLIAAGVAVSLQDVFKNFAGAIAILLSNIYRVGDRIEIDSKYGDVIDIGLFYTALLELRGWVDGEQTTGRITLIPNGKVLANAVHNYTKDHNFLWDEIKLPITYDSDWTKAIGIIKSIVQEKTTGFTKQVEQQISHLEEKYFLSKRNIEPTIFVMPTDNWIMLHIRYVVNVKNRRIIRNRLAKLILEQLQQSPDITIASQTLTINSSTIALTPATSPNHANSE